MRVNNAASMGALQISDRPAARTEHHHQHERARLMCANCSTAIAGPSGRAYRALMRWLGPLLLAVLVGGCATAFPESVMRTVDTRITADELLRDPAGQKGARVILGGDILAVQPRPGRTEIEL